MHAATRAGVRIQLAEDRPTLEPVSRFLAGVWRSPESQPPIASEVLRAWALERGATSMVWTFDPLVSRNAHFDLAKLGASATEYAVDFYGQIDDGVNGHDESDRLTAVWPLSDPHPVHLAGPDLKSAELDPRPALDGDLFSARDENGHWCRVPLDVVTMRSQDQPLAAEWRAAVRDALLPVFDAGFTATGFSRSGWYYLTRKEQP